MLTDKPPITIILADDHNLFRKGLRNIIQSMGEGYEVVGEAADGEGVITLLKELPQVPDLAILDINMPGKDGFQTIQWLNDHYPQIKVLVVSMIEREEVILRMLRMGAKGYLSKDVETADLKKAIDAIIEKGFYYTDFMTGRLLHDLQRASSKHHIPELNERETEILKLACSEFTYKQIADQLFLSIKTVDTYRDSLFKKLGATSRVGLVIYAIRNGIVQL
ncbi:MAG: response regulator transcription factor [Bacteroidota bacterium]